MTNTYQDKTNEQLEGTAKMFKIMIIVIAAVSLPLIGLSLYMMIFQDKVSMGLPLLVVGFSCFSMVPIQMLSMKKIKEEQARRTQTEA